MTLTFVAEGNDLLKKRDKAGLSIDTIWDEIIHRKNPGNSYLIRFNTWDAPLLVDYIVQNHNAYVKETIPQLKELLDKVCSVHGEDHIELIEVRDNSNDLAEELLTHMEKEEKILFPTIKECVQNGSALAPGDSINVMKVEHERSGDLTKSIWQLTNRYDIPRDACTTFKLTNKKLEELDQNLCSTYTLRIMCCLNNLNVRMIKIIIYYPNNN